MTFQPENFAELDPRTLRVVHALAEHGSITAAAAELGFSQPAVSQQLRRLETSIGLPVVERVGRGVRLTEAGGILARHARSITSALDAAAGELAELRGLRSGRVRLAGFPSASPTIVPRLLATLATEHPGLRVSYLEAEPPEAVAAVRENRADIAVTFSYPGDRIDPHRESAQGLAVTELWFDEMRLVLPLGHPLANATSIQLDALSEENWIGGCPRCRGHLLELCDREAFVPRISFETDNFVAVLRMVAAGLGVAMTPQLALDSAGSVPGVVTRPTARGDRRTVNLVTTPDAERVPALRATLATLRAMRPTA